MEQQKIMRIRAQTLKKNMTPEEKKLWYQFLKAYPIQFKRQYQSGCYFADFYCYKARLSVELDGSHHCELKTAIYDTIRTNFLSSQGFYILRISNRDIQNNFRAVCGHIDRIVRERSRKMDE